MRNTRKRIEVLETSLFPRQDPAAVRVITRQALRRLSAEELKLLEDIAVDHQEGQSNGDLTEGESAAMAAYANALQQELQLAGFSSMAEFEQKCCGPVIK